MSAEFLADLLKIENSIKSDPSQPCCICLQNFGTMSSESGVIEYGVRLTCSHYVGSSCIAIWLRSNNTCPVCRHVFFSAQPRPYLEHGVIADETSARNYWGECCSVLNLSNRASAVAYQFAVRLWNTGWLEGCAPNCVGSVAIYIVSHLTGDPKSPEDISPLVNIQPDLIRNVYRSLYPRREQLVTREVLTEPTIRAHMQRVFAKLLDGATLEDMLALLPTSTVEVDFNRHRTEAIALTGLEYDLVSRREHINERLDECCTQLGYDQGPLGGFINLFCRDIAHNIRKTKILDSRSPQPIMAVSIYMGSHLLCAGTSITRISEVVSISERTIRTAYASVYPRRTEIVEIDFFDSVSPVKVRQALAWPPLT